MYRWLETLKLLPKLFKRAVAHLLTDHYTGKGHTEYHMPALPVGKRTQTAAGTVFFSGGLFKLQRLRFACTNEDLQFARGHGLFIGLRKSGRTG